jgi:hypothetical protein
MTAERFEALRRQWNRVPPEVESGEDVSPAAERAKRMAEQVEGADFFAFQNALSQVKDQTKGGGR